MLPNWTHPNPYQRLLSEGLGALGYEVRFGPNTLLALGMEMLRFRPGKVHLHWPDPYWTSSGRLKAHLKVRIFTLLLRVCRILGTTIVWTVHEIDNHDREYLRENRLCNVSLGALAHRVIVHWEEARSEICDFVAPENVTAIEHGNYVAAYPNAASKSAARSALGLPPKALVFLCIGMIRRYKGTLELVHAFRRIPGNDLRLVIAGMVHRPEFLTEVLGASSQDERIIISPGFVPEDRLQYYLNACDAVALPYRHIFSSGAAVLAASFGKVLIAPGLGAIPRIVPPAQSILYDPRCADALYDALSEAKARSTELEAMGLCAQEAVRQWDWNTIALRTSQVYEGKSC